MNWESFIIKNLTEAVTLEPLARAGRFINISADDLGRIKNAWIAVENGKISAIGSNEIPENYKSWKQIDGSGCIALPGLIDAHTHLVFAGIRADEFCMRLDGATYQEIAAKGGGIQSSVRNSSQASDELLENLCLSRLQNFAEHGVTTVEAKSGYGLSIKEELRHLRILKKVAAKSAQTLSPTCLALHAIPKDQPSAKAWAELCAKELLPTVQSENLADAVDAFIEEGYFSVDDAKPYLDKAQALGLPIRLHADEFSDAKAALCAAKYKSLSADPSMLAAIGLSPSKIAEVKEELASVC
ncbi:MAG: hypothetical protein EBU49_12415 [Proteobacteria bacterium]|nr:hypothetical protein [Pseudomonadota bacterium]